MKILVCVKQVPEFDPEAEIEINESGHEVIFDHLTAFRMNRVDENAVEESLLIKKNNPDVTVDALTVGPENAAAVVRRAMGMGADHGIHIKTTDDGHLSAHQIARWISEAVQHHSYDLVFTGIMSEDRMQGQVGPILAEMMSLPCATSTIAEALDQEKGLIAVEREIEGGYRDIVELKLPALLTIQSGINTPRYPSLSNVMRAKRAKLDTIEADSLTAMEQTGRTILGYPEKTRDAKVLEGSPEDKATQLYDLLQEKAIIA